jgi:hypothetical protein
MGGIEHSGNKVGPRREINKLVVHGKIERGLYGCCVIRYTISYRRESEGEEKDGRGEKDEREGWEG